MSALPTDSTASAPSVASNKPRAHIRSHQRNASTSSLASVRSLSENGGIPVSPLKQMNSEPIKHEPKVVSLYNQLFSDKRHHPGYWVEFFLLKVNKPELTRVLAANPQNFVRDPGLTVLHTLVRAAVANLSADLPADIVVNALQVLTVVVSVTLDLQGSGSSLATTDTTSIVTNNTKTLPGFSVIQALAGLDHASAVFDELTSRLLALMYLKNRAQVGEAVNFLLETARKLWGSQISGLFTSKNFFAVLIAIIDDKIDDKVAINALMCIGVLTGVNAYDDDTAAIYKQRLNDYVDEAVMAKILALAQQELLSRDQPNGDSKGSSAHSPAGSTSVLGWLSKWFAEPAPAKQNNGQAALYAVDRVILPLFLFTVYNAVFSNQFAASPALPTLIESSVRPRNFCVSKATPETALASSSTWLSLLAMRNLVDNDFLVITDPTSAAIMRLHSSKLALDSSRRLPLAGILDFAMLIVLQGFKKSTSNPDYALIEQAVDLVYQVCAQMVSTRAILAYNWTQLWKALVSTLKYVATLDTLPPPVSSIVARMLTILVGMSLRRDLFEEEDWRALLFVVVYNVTLFRDLASKFSSLTGSVPVKAAQSMASQYELKSDQPDFTAISRQGILVAGKNVVGEKLRPFSVTCGATVKWAVKQQIVG